MTRLAPLLAVLALVVVAGCAGLPSGDGQAQSRSNGERAAEANTQLGVRYLRDDQPQRALGKLRKALRQDPDNADAHTVSGVVYERLDEPERAAEHYRQAVQLAPENGTARNNYGRFLCNRGEVDRGLEQFRRAVRNPMYERTALALTNAGRCALTAGREEDGEAFLLRALKADDEYAPALLRMARLRLQQGHYMNARAFHQRYLDMAAQSPEAAWIGLRIERRLGNEDAVASYRLLLTNRFADSPQTQRMLEWERNGKL